jgi:cyanate permease
MVGISLVCGVLLAFQVGKVAVALPILRANGSVGLAAASLLIASVGVAGAALGLPAGALAGRVGPGSLAAAGLFVAALGSVAATFAVDGLTLLSARGVEVIGIVAASVALPSLLVSAAAGRDRWLVSGAWGAHMPVGMALVILLAPIVLLDLGWQALWELNALLLALAGLLLLVMTRRRSDPASSATVPSVSDISSTLAAPGPRSLASVFLLYAFQWTTVIGFLPSLYVEHGLALERSAFLTATVVVANAAGNLVGGVLVRTELPRGSVVALSCVVMAISDMVIFANTLPFGATYLGALTFSAFGGLIPATLFAATPLLAPSPRHIPAANGLLLQGSWTGSAVGPVVVGAVASATGGWSASGWLLAPVALFAAMIALRTLDPVRAQKVPPTSQVRARD